MNKNHFAGYLEMIILLTLGVIFTRFEPSASRRVKVPAEEKYAKTAILGFIVLLLLCAHILSGSRGGLVSLAAGLLFFAFLVNSRHFLRKWGILLVIMFPLTLGIVGVLAPMQMSRHVDRFTEQQLEPSFHLRWEIWATQGQIVQDFPIVGSGFGTFPHIARRYQTFVWDRRLVHSESDFLQLLSETGLVGMLLIGGVGVVFFVKTLSRWRRRRSRWSVALVAGGLSAMGSMVVHSGIDFNLHIPSNALLFTVIAALSFVSASLSSERSRR
jgi:O-antigen ligase